MANPPLIPAQAGTQGLAGALPLNKKAWVPAFAGMSGV
jgi:hypothetical protein